MSQSTATAGETRSGELKVRSLDRGAAARWDAFVESAPEATFFHRSGWVTAVERAFGHPSHSLYVEEDGAVCGVLPLAHVKSRLFGNALVSTPFGVYGGAVARDEAARKALEEAACSVAEGLGVDYLELRDREARPGDWPTKDLYVTFRKPIDPDPEVNLRSVPRKQRAMIRKGIEAGLTSELNPNVDRLHRIYAESVRNLGTPVFAKRYFRTLKDAFGDECEILTVLNGDRAVASVMCFYFRDEVLPYYGGGTEAARDVKANDFMYWEVMRRAGELGMRVFDYGRSKKDTGSYRFKKHWGFEPQPLHYRYHLVRAKKVPEVNPLNPRYRLFVEAWKRLPVPMANAIGPWISRGLG